LEESKWPPSAGRSSATSQGQEIKEKTANLVIVTARTAWRKVLYKSTLQAKDNQDRLTNVLVLPKQKLDGIIE
jgi:hypothetical protein